LCADRLAGNADIGKTRLSTKRKRSRRAPPKQPFIRCQAFSRPMPAPVLDCLGIGAKGLGTVSGWASAMVISANDRA